jgi:cytochrome c oxidase assembly protein subunit 11
VFSSFSLHKNGKQKTVINFTAKVDDNLKNVIEFIPEKSMVDVQNGKIFSNNFIAKNLTNKNIVITNRFTVQPEEIGIYLERIECLCFKNQPIDSAKEVNMPVSFRINLEVEKDKNFENIKEITINYQAYLAE